ncbi:MAG: hypothetical protein ACOYJY_03250 [Acutalibacteraceae bacterium]|jgi:hypothetical protein
MNDTPLNVIGYIDEPLIEKADTYTAKKTVRWPKVLAIAACLCLVIASVTAFAAGGWGTKLIDSFTGRREAGSDLKESGFDLSVAIERIPTNALSKEARDIGEVIRRQFRDRQPFDNRYPGDWQKDFASRGEARAFVGLDRIKAAGDDWDERPTTLTISGDENGRIIQIGMEADRAVGDVSLQFFTTVFTEHGGEEITSIVRTTEDVAFTESRFTTKNHIACHVITSSATESGYLSVDGYIVDDGILYDLHIAYLEKDAALAADLLRQWADRF